MFEEKSERVVSQDTTVGIDLFQGTSERLGGIIDCKYKTSSWLLNGFADGSNIVGSTI